MKDGLIATILGWLQSRPSSSGNGPATLEGALDGLPEDLRVYAIGDIHGCASLLAKLHDEIDRRESRAATGRRVVEVVLGDFIDRGPDSQRVVEVLLQRAKHRVLVVLRGNHEQLMLDALDDPQHLPAWLRLGGLETLRSYGVTPAVPIEGANLIETIYRARELIPQNHLDFLANLPVVFRCRDLIFVHAGIRPGIAIDQQDHRDMITIREPFLSHDGSSGCFVVHGHTPVSEVEIRRHRMNLDTGAYATGRLSGAVFERGGFEVIEVNARAIDR
jgi:serine/threonine protein phosphatase 1